MLYMRSASNDLTARARIRDAAIRAFARDGFDAASMRTIAADAGVSPALIVHHFGDKNALRAACDDYVAAVFIDDKHELIEAPTPDRIRMALDDIERYGPFLDYLARMLADSTPAADRLFDHMVQVTRQVLAEQREAGLLVEMSDPEMTVLLMAMLGLAPVMMRAHVARTLGTPDLNPSAIMRTWLPTLELLTHGIYSTPAFLDAAREAISLPPAQPTEDEEPAEGGV